MDYSVPTPTRWRHKPKMRNFQCRAQGCGTNDIGGCHLDDTVKYDEEERVSFYQGQKSASHY
jgi:hypothetical protein